MDEIRFYVLYIFLNNCLIEIKLSIIIIVCNFVKYHIYWVSYVLQQVDHWSQDLVEIEHAAKESAAILFYVIDSQTRNVVSDIETANFAGYHKNLVLVIHPQDAIAGSVVAGEPISYREAEDLREALTALHKIAAHQRTLVFDNIPEGLNNVVQVFKILIQEDLRMNTFMLNYPLKTYNVN